MWTLGNVGAPMLVVTGWVMLLALVPIIVIEAVVLWRRLRVGFWKSVAVSTGANAISTLVGVPLTWFVLLFIQKLIGWLALKPTVVGVLLNPAWLPSPDSEYYWMAPLAAMILNVPFAAASIWIEGVVIGWWCAGVEARAIRRACLWGNVITYGGLTVFWLVVLVHGLTTRG